MLDNILASQIFFGRHVRINLDTDKPVKMYDYDLK